MTDTTANTAQTVTLDIGGMTCATCAGRITKRLNKMDGVDASVNYATEQATVSLPDGVTVEDVVSQVEAIGYTASVPTPADPGADPSTFAPVLRALELDRTYPRRVRHGKRTDRARDSQSIAARV